MGENREDSGRYLVITLFRMLPRTRGDQLCFGFHFIISGGRCFFIFSLFDIP